MLTKFNGWLRTVLLEEPPAALKPKPKTPSKKNVAKPVESLRYSDLSLDDPAEALRALRRATRTPPHLRHLSNSTEESLSAYTVSLPPTRNQAESQASGSQHYRPSPPDVRAVERQRRDTFLPAPRSRDRNSATG